MADDLIFEVGAEIDRSSLRTVQQTLKSFENSAVGGLARNTAAKVRDIYSGLDRAARETRQNIDEVTAAIQRQDRAADSASSRQSFGRRGAEIADRAGSVGSQVLSGLGAGDAANTVGLIGDIGGALTALNPIGLAATVGFGALTVAISSAVDATARVTEATRRRLQIEREAEEFLLTATRRQTQDRIEDINRLIVAEQARNAELRGEIDTITAGLNPLDQFRETANLAFGEVDALRGALDESNGLITQYSGELQALTTGLVDGATATNDAAEAALAAASAERQLAQERFNALDAQVQAAIEAQRLIRDGSSEQLDSIQQQLQIERSVRENALRQLESEIASGQFTGDALADAQVQAQAFRDRIEEITSSIATNASVIRPLIEAREAEARAVQRQTQAYAEAKGRATQRAQEELRANEQAAQERERSNEKVAQSETRIGEIRAQAAQRTSDLIASAATEQQRAARDSQRAIARIIRDGGREQLSAIGDRDALAFTQSNRATQDQLDDARQDAKDAQGDRADDLRRSLDQEARARDQAIAQESNKINTEIRLQQSGAQASLNLQSSYFSQRLQLEQQGLNASLQQIRGLGGASQRAAPPVKQAQSGGYTAPLVSFTVQGANAQTIVQQAMRATESELKRALLRQGYA